MIPPPTRQAACRLTVTYAGFSGESVLLEELHKRGMAQPEVAPNLYAGDGLLMAWHHEPIAPWQTGRWLAEMRRSLRPNQFLRMIENRFVTAESSFVDMAKWDSCVDPGLTPIFADRDLPAFVAVDASVKHDSTAIVAVTPLPDGRLRLVTHRIFQPSPKEPLDFEAAVEATLIELCSRFAVRRILCDPYQMVATAQRLQKRGLPIREFPQTVPNLTEASQGLYELIESRSLVLYPDAAMRLAASRAIAIETTRGWRIAKEKQSHKIDVIVALGMAAHAALDAARFEQVIPLVAPVIFYGDGSSSLDVALARAGDCVGAKNPEIAARAKEIAARPSVPRPPRDPNAPLNSTELFLLHGGGGDMCWSPPGGWTRGSPTASSSG
jgi:hypothetical protein